MAAIDGDKDDDARGFLRPGGFVMKVYIVMVDFKGKPSRIIATKLNRAAASRVVDSNPGSRIVLQFADKL